LLLGDGFASPQGLVPVSQVLREIVSQDLKLTPDQIKNIQTIEDKYYDQRTTLRQDVATANREARSFTVGTNWFPNQSVKIYATFEQTEFSGGAERPTEHVILFRTQLGF